MRRTKTIVLAAVLTVVSFIVLFGGADPKAAATHECPGLAPGAINVRANIDGRSHLIIQGNGVHWHHFDSAAPGRWLVPPKGSNPVEPTQVNCLDWFPTWPDVPNAENRDCDCDSSTLNPNPTPPSLEDYKSTSFDDCRGTCSVIEAPSAGNGHRLTVELNDNSPVGSAWYEVTITTNVVGGLAALPQIDADYSGNNSRAFGRGASLIVAVSFGALSIAGAVLWLIRQVARSI